MVAIPRLTPPGPYEMSTFLIGPTDLTKYSYCVEKGLVSGLMIVHKVIRAFIGFDFDFETKAFEEIQSQLIEGFAKRK